MKKTDKQKLYDIITSCKSQIKLRHSPSKKPSEFDNGIVYMADLILRKADEL